MENEHKLNVKISKILYENGYAEEILSATIKEAINDHVLDMDSDHVNVEISFTNI